MEEGIAPPVLPSNHLPAFLLLSFLLHLWVLGSQAGNIISIQGRDVLPPKTVQLSFAQSVSNQQNSSRLPEIQDEKPQVKQIKDGEASNPDASAVIPDSHAELVSRISGYMDFPIQLGFIILRIDIDDMGVVEGTEVIYSELSRYATRQIAQRFAEARYRPAIRNGHSVSESILLKIDITP